MVAKIIEGKSFGGCVGYVLKDKSEIIHAEGLRTTSAQTIAQDFNLQRKLNPRLGKAVGHIVLSWSEHDKGKLTNGLMADRKSTRLNSSHVKISYAVFCLKK